MPENDRAGESYWNDVWSGRSEIPPIDIEYYTYAKLHGLFKKFLPGKPGLSLLEIGAAFSSFLPYFHKYFHYKVSGLDYEDEAAKRTEALYKESGIQASIHHRDFFETTPFPLYDVLTSFGVFEHFENLPASIAQTRHYLRPNGTIVTVIPNMNGLVGWLQKSFNRAVYDIHIPYRKEDLLQAHEKAGYTTLFCDYFGTYQGGVVNLSGHPREKVWQKILAAPGKPMHLLETILGKRLDGVFHSPYVIYIGMLGE